MTDSLVNEWGPARRPRIRAWLNRRACRRHGCQFVPLRMTWSERRDGWAWEQRSVDNGGERCSRCGSGRVTLTITPDGGTVYVADIKAVWP